MNNKYTENASFGLSTDEIARVRYQFDTFIREMYACLPCKVLAVNGGGLAPVGTANIQPLIQQQTATGEMVPYPVIYNAPYFRLQGGANAIIIDPEPGDIGFAVFSSRDISGVKRTRGAASTASLRKFSLSDAIYVNGILNSTPRQYIQFSNAGITVYSPTAINLTAPTVTITADQQVTVDTPLMTITGQMTQTGAKGTGAQTSGGITNTGGTISSNGIVLETHVHSGVEPGGSNTGEPV
jgi:hypothetical protein